VFPQRWIEAYLRFLLRRRAVVTVLVALLTLGFAVALTHLRLQADFADFYPRRHPYIQFYNEFRSMFGTANIMSVILEVRHGDIYNPETLQKLDRITRFIIYTKGVVSYQISSIAHPKVRSVVPAGHGMINVREIFYPGVPKTQEDADRVRFSVYADPAVRGIYTANDDTAAIVHAAFWEEALDYNALYDRMMELKRAEEDGNHRIYITGFPWLYTSVLRYTSELKSIFACTLLSLSFLLYAYFRTWTGIWVPIFSGVVSSVWGLGIAALLGFNLDPLVLVIPIFLTARALSHSVQSMDRYHEEYRRVSDKQQAIVISYSHLFAPAIASIVTDGIGLLVVAVAPIPLVQKVAIFASFWVISIFVSVVTLHPIILSFINPPPRRGARAMRPPRVGMTAAMLIVAAALGAAAVAARAQLFSGLWAFAAVAPVLAWFWLTYSDALYSSVTEFTIACSHGQRRWAIVVITAALYVILPMWGWTLKVGDMTPGAALLFPDHPYNVAARLLDAKFLGADQLIVVADALKPNGIKDSAALRAMDEFSAHMQSARGASLSISIADVVKQAARLWHEGDPKWGTVPAKLREQTELLFVFESAASGDLGRFVDRSARYASIVTLFHAHSHDIIRDAIRWAKDFDGGPAVRFRFAGGLFGILAAVNESVENSYWLNLGMIFAIVYACLYLTYGSWLASAILMVPVILSQLAAEALMVVMHIDLNVNSLPVAAAGAGVGVDYGIYHLSRMTFNTFGGLIVVPAFVKVLRPKFLTSREFESRDAPRRDGAVAS